MENNLRFSDTILLDRLMSETLVGVIAAHTMQFFSRPLSLSSRKVLRLQLSGVNPSIRCWLQLYAGGRTRHPSEVVSPFAINSISTFNFIEWFDYLSPFLLLQTLSLLSLFSSMHLFLSDVCYPITSSGKVLAVSHSPTKKEGCLIPLRTFHL